MYAVDLEFAVVHGRSRAAGDFGGRGEPVFAAAHEVWYADRDHKRVSEGRDERVGGWIGGHGIRACDFRAAAGKPVNPHGPVQGCLRSAGVGSGPHGNSTAVEHEREPRAPHVQRIGLEVGFPASVVVMGEVALPPIRRRGCGGGGSDSRRTRRGDGRLAHAQNDSCP